MNFLVVQDDDEGRQSESSADNVEDEDEEDTSGNDEDQSEYESFEVVLQIHKNIFFWLTGGRGAVLRFQKSCRGFCF